MWQDPLHLLIASRQQARAHHLATASPARHIEATHLLLEVLRLQARVNQATSAVQHPATIEVQVQAQATTEVRLQAITEVHLQAAAADSAEAALEVV